MTQQATTESMIPLPRAVLQNLLQTLELEFDADTFEAASKRVEQQETGAGLLSSLAELFYELKIQGVQSAFLKGSRFDPRSLPALVYKDDIWLMVQHGGNGTLRATDEQGNEHPFTLEAFSDARVLWLKLPPKRNKHKQTSIRQSKAVRWVLEELFRSHRWVRDVVVATIVINILAISTSLFAMQVYDRVVPTLAYATLWTLAIGMAGVVCMDWLLKTLRARILDSLSCELNDNLSQRVYEHVLNLRLDSRPRSLGTLAAQVNGLDTVRQFFSSGVVFVLVDLPFALMFILFIAIIGGSIAWVYVGLLPFALALGILGQRSLRRLMKEQLIRSHERQGLLVDSIQGMESIRSSNAGWGFSRKWADVTKTISEYNVQQKAINNFTSVTTASLSMVAYVCAIVVGVHGIEAGNLTMGALIACSIIGGRVIAPVSQAMQYLTQWQNVIESLELVDQVLELETERRDEQHLLLPSDEIDSIVLNQVQFSYPGSPIKQLDVPSLTLNAGDRILLVGSIGSGKSTLLKVLAGLYKPTEGHVRMAGADLWELDPQLLSSQVGYLPQSVHLFKGTLRSNLNLSGTVSDARLLDVSKEIGIDKIAMDNPLSMDLEISEGGEGLSGGQKQLVGLGRVMLGKPKVWLLDEPTASLDVESDSKVLEAIERHVAPEDILLVSTHRVAMALKFANRVLLMRQGQIIEDGKPEDVVGKISQQQPQGNKTKSLPMNRGFNNAV